MTAPSGQGALDVGLAVLVVVGWLLVVVVGGTVAITWAVLQLDAPPFARIVLGVVLLLAWWGAVMPGRDE